MMEKISTETFKEVKLERLSVGARDFLDGHALKKLTLHTHMDAVLDGMLLNLKTEILSEKLNEVEYMFVRPSSWWQAFKDEYFPNWLLKRFPIEEKVTTVKFKEYTMYPQFPEVMPDCGPQVHKVFLEER